MDAACSVLQETGGLDPRLCKRLTNLVHGRESTTDRTEGESHAMAANEIVNRVVLMCTFNPGANQGAVATFRTLGVDETFLGSTKGVTRTGAGAYSIRLSEPLVPGNDADGPDVIPSVNNTLAGTVARASISNDGLTVLVTNATDAGVAADTGQISVILHKYPTNN